MNRTTYLKAEKGSKKWIQEIVNSRPKIINDKIRKAFKLEITEKIDWKSPLSAEGYKEYQDQEFLDILEIKLEKRPLDTFWPTRGGPHWDALAKTSKNSIILVEAKSHIDEIDTNATEAEDERLVLIQASLEETKKALNSKSITDWSKCFYQYTNRLAFLYLLWQNGINTYLINVYFVKDPTIKNPQSEEEWKGALRLLKKHLGVSRHKLNKYTSDIFIQVN